MPATTLRRTSALRAFRSNASLSCRSGLAVCWAWLCCASLVGGQEKPSAQADIGFIGLHGGVFEHLQGFATGLSLRLRYFADDEMRDKSADLATVRVLYVQHVREEDRDAYRAVFDAARRRNPQLRVIVFQASSAEFLKSLNLGDVVHADANAPKYYGSSPENLRRLLVYTAATYLDRSLPIEPPQEVDRAGFYHPDQAELLPTAEAFMAWRRGRSAVLPTHPRLLIAVHATHLAFQQPRVVDALIREAERQGAVAAAIIDGRSKTYEREAIAFAPHAIIHTCHSADSVPFRLQLDAPHLHSIFIRKQSIDEWRTSVEGLSSSELAFHVIGQELIGGIEPQVAAGVRQRGGGSEALEPIPDRVEHLVSRALAYARLALTPPAQKKVAIVYYDREMGKGELMRGSATGMHMNGPRSLLNVLASMRKHGYAVDPFPKHEDELLSWMIARGRLVGVWAPRELDRMAREGSPALIPAEQYEAWFRRFVPEDRRRQVEEKWGPAPGRFMVWRNAGKSYLVVPRIELGNVILLPQPLRGELHGKEDGASQTHDKTTAPPHNYLATYFWLQQEVAANAVVHFGTHGSEFQLPGKPNGLSAHDWPDILFGHLPNFNPWIIENMVESSPVRRRAYGTLISHLSPPIVNAGLGDGLSNLHDTIEKWQSLDEGALKSKFRDEVSRLVRQERLHIDLRLTGPDERPLDDAEIQRVDDHLHSILEETTPTSLHVFGEPPRDDLVVPYLVNILRPPFLRQVARLLDPDHEPHEQVSPRNGAKASARENSGETHEHSFDHAVRPAAEKLVDLVVRRGLTSVEAAELVAGREIDTLPVELEKSLQLARDVYANFARTTDELASLLRGLDGKFVPPGPGNNPIRNPSSVPTGRNMYLLNPDEIPSRPSWELGKRLVDELIAKRLAEHGSHPTKVGFDLRSSATFRDYGVMESQILYLLGVEPVWDERQLIHELRLIPREELGRPRVDVFIAAGSWYESNLPGRLQLWDRAVRLAAGADEPDNPLRANVRQLRDTLISQGIAKERAETLSYGRIFGLAPGREVGSFLSYQVARSGDWNDRAEIAANYLATHRNVFTEGAWGEEAAPLYDAAIQGTHTVLRSWSDHMTGPLASKYVWLHGGGLSLAVEAVTGKRPEYVLSDVRDPDRAALTGAEDALRKEFRVRLFNRKWLEGMMKEGYAGGDHLRVMVSNSFGWETMRPGSVGTSNWQEMKQVLVDDKLKLDLRDWFERHNPYALQDSTAVMLEAIRKGYWDADEATRRQLAVEYASQVARHGLSGHITSGGNQALDGFVRGELQRSGDDRERELLAEYATRIDEQRESPTQVGVAKAAASELAPDAAPASPLDPASSTAAAPPPNAPSSAATESAAAPVASASDVSVTGRRLQPVEAPQSAESPTIPRVAWLFGIVALGVFCAGLLLRGSV